MYTYTTGAADYCAQEEFDRYRGFWWSEDSAQIVYCMNDESHIPVFDIHHQGKADPHQREQHRYPFAGEANPKVRLFVAPIPRDSNDDLTMDRSLENKELDLVSG